MCSWLILVNLDASHLTDFCVSTENDSAGGFELHEISLNVFADQSFDCINKVLMCIAALVLIQDRFLFTNIFTRLFQLRAILDCSYAFVSQMLGEICFQYLFVCTKSTIAR